jgi:hypothetical protein
MTSQRVLFSFALLGALALATQARATVIAPGTSVVPDAQSNPLTDPTATIVATASGTFNASNLDFGTYKEYVVKESSGTLDFVYQFTNDPNSGTALERASMYHFTGFSANVGFVAGSGDVPPVTADRTSGGTVIGFNFPASNGVPTGKSSDLLIIRTNATSFDNTGTFTFQDGAATTVPGFAPAAVPEPSALVLTGLGGLVLAGYTRRSRRMTTA